MMELRWFEIETGSDGPRVYVDGRPCKLQWRYSRKVVTSIDDPPGGVWVGGPWHDVPLERLPAPPAALPMSDEVRSLS